MVIFINSAFAQGNDVVNQREKERWAMIKSYDSKPADIHFGTDRSSFNNPYFKKEVRNALKNRMNPNHSVGDMRLFYTQTSQYDPFAKKTKEKMFELAYLVEHSDSIEETSQALDKFDGIIKSHMANTNVMALAITFAKKDRRFGDPRVYQWMTQKIMEDILRYRTGRSFEEAYIIVSTDEEDLLLRYLKVDLLKTEFIPYGSRYYNIHTVKDRRSGKTREIFVDVTMPLAKAEALQKQAKNKLDLRK